MPSAYYFFSTLSEEVSETIGKRSVRQRRETVYSLAFLGMFWTLLFLLISVVLGSRFVIREASLPILAIRIPVEIALTYVSAQAVIHADRSTLGFIRLLAIPIVLGTDLVLGYNLSLVQIVAVATMFIGLVVAFHDNPAGKRGAGWALLVALLAATSATLYKFDITHYNTVAAEQIIVYGCVLIFFYVCSARNSGSPLKLLLKPATGIQSLTNGFGLAIESFAYTLAPASVIVATKRSLALFWSIVFGHRYFHEHKLRRKLFAGAVLAGGLVLMVSPYF